MNWQEQLSLLVGGNTRRWRAIRGMTQADLAEKAGVDRPIVGRFESGKHVPHTHTIQQYAEALNVSVSQLVEGIDLLGPPPPPETRTFWGKASADHRWSGWPGAWCLDCGIEDPREACIGTNPECVCYPGSGEPCKVEVPLCPEPGSRRHDPYS